MSDLPEKDLESADVSIGYPDAGEYRLRIRVGACRLRIRPGDGESWVSGTYRYPHGALPLKIERSGGDVTITQDYDVSGLGNIIRHKPRFDLALARKRPFALILEAGASEVSVDLGGVPVRALTVKLGAGKVELGFSALNPEVMSLFSVYSGAALLQLKNLANANFREMIFDGGAASYRVDFGGSLQHEAHASVSTSMAQVEIRIPPAVPARVFENTIAAALDLGDGYTKKGGAFLTEAAAQGAAPALTVHANVSLGTLSLRSE